jgi:hypothetical protein
MYPDNQNGKDYFGDIIIDGSTTLRDMLKEWV